MVMGLTARVWHLLCLGSSQSFSITDVHPGHLHLEFSICKKKKKKNVLLCRIEQIPGKSGEVEC